MSPVMPAKTIGQFSRQNGYPEWLVRRVVDSLGMPIPRVGQYRALTPEIESQLLAELSRRGVVPSRREAIPC